MSFPAYNLGNLWRRTLPKGGSKTSLARLQQRLVNRKRESNHTVDG